MIFLNGKLVLPGARTLKDTVSDGGGSGQRGKAENQPHIEKVTGKGYVVVAVCHVFFRLLLCFYSHDRRNDLPPPKFAQRKYPLFQKYQCQLRGHSSSYAMD